MTNYTQNNHNFEAECKALMAQVGLPFDGQIIPDGKIYRYSKDANKSKRDEYYIAYNGYTSHGNYYFGCTFGSWSDSSKHEYKSNDRSKQYSESERNELCQAALDRRREAEQAIKLTQDQAAQTAQKLWAGYASEAPSVEYIRYTRQKGIEPIGGVKFGLTSQNYPAIFIPLRNAQGELRSLQFIYYDADGKSKKRFLLGGEKSGNFHIIGSMADSTELFVVEGYATGASVHQATAKPVVIAFDAGNLDRVIENIKKEFPTKKITIAGDDDEAGRKKGLEAAAKHGCKFVVPKFPEGKQGKGINDFNDLHKISGIDEVCAQLLPPKQDVALEAPAGVRPTGKAEPCEAFQLAALPAPLREYIEHICKTTNAHPIMVTASVLTMVSSMFGTKVCISNREYFQNLYPNLWMLCIAKSGQFKTTALNKGAKIAYDEQALIFKEIRAMRAAQKASEDESDDFAARILARSCDNSILPTKITAEALLEHLAQGHQGGIFASEFGGWLQNLDKTHNNDFKAILTELYDVPLVYRYKTKTSGDCIIENAYISICGVSTMAWLDQNLKPSDVSSGFFARYLIFTPPHQDQIPPAFPASTPEDQIEENKFKSILNDILACIGEGRQYELPSDTRKLFEELHAKIYSMPAKYGDKAEEILQPYLKRWSPYLLKLAMVLQPFINAKSNEISPAAVIAAWNVLQAAMLSTAALFEGELGESTHQRKCTVLFNWMCTVSKQTGKPITRHKIIGSKKLPGGTRDFDSVLETLIDEGKIECRNLNLQKKHWEYILSETVE